jgi:hypothetical protein
MLMQLQDLETLVNPECFLKQDVLEWRKTIESLDTIVQEKLYLAQYKNIKQYSLDKWGVGYWKLLGLATAGKISKVSGFEFNVKKCQKISAFSRINDLSIIDAIKAFEYRKQENIQKQNDLHIQQNNKKKNILEKCVKEYNCKKIRL